MKFTPGGSVLMSECICLLRSKILVIIENAKNQRLKKDIRALHVVVVASIFPLIQIAFSVSERKYLNINCYACLGSVIAVTGNVLSVEMK